MSKPQGVRFLRFDWAYHFTTLPLALIGLVGSCVYLIDEWRADKNTGLALLAFVLALALLFTAARVRRYATLSQDRIIRTEEQFRHYRLTGQVLDPKLSLSQIIALRYAGDDEFPALCVRAAAENMAPDAIRSAIRNWRADTMRI